MALVTALLSACTVTTEVPPNVWLRQLSVRTGHHWLRVTPADFPNGDVLAGKPTSAGS